jgi:hypothetical protein
MEKQIIIINGTGASDDDFLFIHIREPEEIERAKKTFGAKTLLIKRQGHKNITSNDSDANVDNYNYDYIITNSSLESLEEEAKNFIQSFEEKRLVKKVD